MKFPHDPSTLLKVGAIVLVVLFFYSTYLYVSLRDCEDNLVDLASRYASLSQDYNDLSRRYSFLSSEYNSLRLAYLRLSDDYDVLESRYEDISRKYSSLQDVVRSYAVDINYVYYWLSVNGRLSDRQFSSEVRGCLEGDVLNYPCVLFRRGYRYIPDANDQAKTLPQFISDRGGDCEDYAFYAAALIRTATQKGYRIKFYNTGLGDFYVTSRWYIPGAVPLVLTVRDVNVVCGTDPLDTNIGHCIISVHADEGDYYIEPQTGGVTLPLLESSVFAPGVALVLGRDISSFCDAVHRVDRSVPCTINRYK